jgi:hypothetical protein
VLHSILESANANKSQIDISSRYTKSIPRNDDKKIILEPTNDRLSSKDAEMICEIVINSGIDTRSLAFEILTKRVANCLLLRDKSAKGTFLSLLFVFEIRINLIKCRFSKKQEGIFRANSRGNPS